MPSGPDTPARGRRGSLLLIGSVAGVYSGLFGVGGGTIIVPLLMMLLLYDAREATATSMAAIMVIATAGAITHGIYGNVDLEAAAVLAVPAIAGALVGTALQQRVPKDAITFGLALLLIAGGIDLLLGA